MKNLSKRLIFAVFGLTVAATVASCSGKRHMKTEFTEENKAIPPEFGSDKNTVLVCVLQGRNSYDKYLKSAVKKNYKGQYVLVNSKQLNEAPYNDTSKYRYAFDYGSGSSVSYTGSSLSTTFKRFHIYDRLNKKKWESGAEFSFFAKAMKVYMANLEAKRQSMQK